LDFKDFLIKKVLVSYFLAVTGISAAIGIIGSIFAGETSFGYQAFLSPFLFGLVAVVPSLATYSIRSFRRGACFTGSFFTLCCWKP
jgi:hypothetical protein